MNNIKTPLVLSVAALVALAGCSGSDTGTQAPATSAAVASSAPASPTTDAAADAPAAAGGWITLEQYQKDPAKYADSDVVLFFNASWCPTCQNTVESLDARKADFPTGLTVVSVDYDTATDLKKQYGVTTQHTFVQIDESGAEIKKWTGTETVDAIQAKV